MQMIVVGLDVDKQSVTVVAVDEAGRPLDEAVILVGSDGLLGWASSLAAERLWAVEDCRQLTRWLERRLLSVGEDLVRVPPKLTVPERRAGRTRGKSDPIDALAVARAALREPDLSRPRPDERVYWEIKLLVGHRDDVVDQRRRTQQRLRWHLHQLDPTFEVPLRMLGRASQLERVSRWLARREQELQVKLARELVSTIRSLNRTITELDQELEQRACEIAPALLELPGCAAVTAAKLLAEIGPIDRFKSDAQLARHGGVAPLEASSGHTQRHRLDRGGNRQLNAALYRIAITQARYHAPARDYLDRKRAEGKSRREALRCLKTPPRPRRLPDPENEPRLDIGATLAQTSGQFAGAASSFPSWTTTDGRCSTSVSRTRLDPPRAALAEPTPRPRPLIARRRAASPGRGDARMPLTARRWR